MRTMCGNARNALCFQSSRQMRHFLLVVLRCKYKYEYEYDGNKNTKETSRIHPNNHDAVFELENVFVVSFSLCQQAFAGYRRLKPFVTQ